MPEAYSETDLYENQDYGFTIEYPSGWIFNDTLPQKNKWVEIVSFLPETTDWSQGIYVNKWIGDLKAKEFDANEFLEIHNKAAQDWCSSVSKMDDGFNCMNYSLIDQKTVSVSGRDSFLLEESWTRIEGETSSEILVYNLQIPDGEDKWTIIAESKKEILKENSNILKNALDSFTLLNQTNSGIEKTPSLKHQLKNNVEPTNLSCNPGFVLFFKESDKSPACVNTTSVQKLIDRGWGFLGSTTKEISSQTILDTDQTVIGQQIQYPFGSPKITSKIVTIPVGAETGPHIHEYPMFAYIMKGEVTVDYGEKGFKTFVKGDSIVEAINYIHNGKNNGGEPTEILIVLMSEE